MRGHYLKAFYALPVVAFTAYAADVFRCEDAQGRISYSQHGCPSSSTLEHQRVSNPSPSSGQPSLMAKPRPAAKPTKEKPNTVVTVVGSAPDDCGNLLNNRQKRSAIIKKQVRQGMNRQEVESAIGRPQRITSRNGDTQYRYLQGKRQIRSVTFDETGCVKGNSNKKSQP